MVSAYRRVFDEVVGRVRAGIEGRDLSVAYIPGTPLPKMDDLAAELGVSRATVIRALGVLNQLGLIQGERGSGSLVAGRHVAVRALALIDEAAVLERINNDG